MQFSRVMKKAEKVGLFLIPCSYIVIDILSSYIPRLSDLIDIKGYLVALSCQIMLFFLYIDSKNNAQPIFTRSEQLIYGLVSLIRGKHFSEVEILAVNGFHYHRAIKESQCKIDKLTLLLRAPNIETMAFPTEEHYKKELIKSTKQLIKQWNELKTSGQVSELCIEYYDFDTTLHYMILDNKLLFGGLLYPQKEFPGSEVLPIYIVKGTSIEAEKMIGDFSRKMEMLKQVAVSLKSEFIQAEDD